MSVRFAPVVTVVLAERVLAGERGRRVTCSCGQQDWLRLVLMGTLVAVWCSECGRAWGDPEVSSSSVALWIGPDTPRWDLADDQARDDLERAHPGITDVIARLGARIWLNSGDEHVPMHGLPSRPGDWIDVEEMAAWVLRDEQPRSAGENADEVVLVPMSQRELRLLVHAVYPQPQREREWIAHRLILELQRRSTALISTDPDHVRQVAAADSIAMQRLLCLAAIRRSGPAAVEARKRDTDEVF